MPLKTIDLQIYIYSGTQGSYSDSDLRYTITKEKLTNDTNIIFEVSELVRDYIDLTFDNDYVSRTLWVTTIATYKDNNNVVFTYGSPATDHYLALEGYGYFEDQINPQLSTNALITTSNIYLPDDTAGKIPIFAEGV